MVFLIESVGYFAGLFTTLALLPQAIKSWRSKHTRDVSMGWITTLVIGVILWLVYGIFISSWPIIIANMATLTLALAVLALKLKHG